MPLSITQSFGTADTSIANSGLASLANGSSSTSSAVTSVTHVSIELDITLTGTASSTAGCWVFMQRSQDASDYADTNNDQYIGFIQMNGTNAVRWVRRIDGVPPNFKIRISNQSGADLASSGSAITYRGAQYQSA